MLAMKRKIIVTPSALVALGFKRPRLPRKKKKELKLRWGHIWTSFIKITNLK